MSYSLYRKAAVIGIGEVGPGALGGKTARELHVEATRLALEDAGLDLKDIDGIMSPELRLDHYNSRASMLAEYLDINPLVTITQAWGGATTLSMVFQAASLIAAGLASTILITCADNPGSSLGTTGFMKLGAITGSRHPQYEWPYGTSAPASYALIAQRHMHDYGTTSEQLANIAVTFRNHAMRHPKALRRTPITIQDVLSSRMIASPLHLLDCCPVSDGGAAVIVTSSERAAHMKQKPVFLLGAAEAHTHMHISYAPSLTSFAAAVSAPRAFAMAGLERKDIDVLYIYDSFTITALIQLEDLGFCKKGEGGPFVEGNRLGINGELPTNTHGGLLSYSHPGRPGPYSHLLEMVKQLRGQAQERQVKDAKIGLINAQGGANSVSCTMILAA